MKEPFHQETSKIPLSPAHAHHAVVEFCFTLKLGACFASEAARTSSFAQNDTDKGKIAAENSGRT